MIARKPSWAVAAVVAAIPATAAAQAPIPLTQLSVLWEVNAGNGHTDYMTTATPSERDEYPFLGAIAYIANGGTALPVYRLNNGYDHMDSTVAGEGGYSTEGELGTSWNTASALPGLTALSRLYNPTTGDHATTTQNANVLFGGSAYSGYDSDAGLGYAYQRYGNLSAAPVSYSAGGVTETSDSVAGGAVSGWTWNGAQFINTNDYGRYLQSDLFIAGSDGITYNPIEAGDVISGPQVYGTNVGKWHGSPVLYNQITNGVHITRAIPLEYGLPGGNGVRGYPVTPASAFVYGGMQIGKNLTLNYEGLGPVAKYQTVIVSPVSLSGVGIEIPTAWLNPQYATFFTFDAGSNALSQVSVQSGCGNVPENSFRPASGFGGVIISDSSQAHALGIYGDNSVSPGSDNQPFSFADDRNCGNTTTMRFGYYGPLNAGENDFPAYIVSGTVSQVASLMESLYYSGN